MGRHFMVSLAVAAAAVGGARAQQPQPQPQEPQPLPLAEVDKRAKRVAHHAIEVGVALFNAGERSPTPQANYEGTARLYEGTLMALVPMLDHRPDTVKAIQFKLDASRTMAKAADRAFALRDGLDEVVKIGAKQVTLWSRLGGEPAVRAVAKEFIAASLKNPKVNFLRDGKFKGDGTWVSEQVQLLVEMISSATGGPLKYSGRDMKTVHAGMKITADEFDAMADDLVVTLEKFKVPLAEKIELMKIVAGTKGDIVEVKK
jgi:hemoglobin